MQINDPAHALPSARTPRSSILLSFSSASHLQRAIYRTFLCLLHISGHTIREQRSDVACDSCFRDGIVLPCDWGHECWLLGLLRRMAAENTAEGADRRCMLGNLADVSCLSSSCIFRSLLWCHSSLLRRFFCTKLGHTASSATHRTPGRGAQAEFPYRTPSCRVTTGRIAVFLQVPRT